MVKKKTDKKLEPEGPEVAKSAQEGRKKKQKQTEEPKAVSKEAVPVEESKPKKVKKQRSDVQEAVLVEESKPKKLKKQRNDVQEADPVADPKPKKQKKRAADADVEEPTAKKSKGATEPGKVTSTIFVSGVPWEWNEENIADTFSKWSDNILEIRAPKWQDSGRSKGYCHIDFDIDSKAAEAVRDMHHKRVQSGTRNPYLVVQLANVKQGPETDGKLPRSSKTIFVKNLPYDADEKEIAKLFTKEGGVKSVRISHVAGRSKGFAYIEFSMRQDALKVLKKRNEFKLRGRQLVVDADKGEAKAGFHYRKEAYESGFAGMK